MYQEPPKSATLFFFFLLTLQGLLPAWVHLSPTLGVKIQPPQPLYWQQSPSAPSPHLADFTKELYNSVTWESESRHFDLGSLPTRLAAPRSECSSHLGGEPHPQVSVPETPPQEPAVGPDAAGNPSKVLGDWSPEGQPAWLLGDRWDPSSLPNKTATDSKQAPLLTLGNFSPRQSRQADSGSEKELTGKATRHLFTTVHSKLRGTESKATGAEVAPAAR